MLFSASMTPPAQIYIYSWSNEILNMTQDLVFLLYLIIQRVYCNAACLKFELDLQKKLIPPHLVDEIVVRIRPLEIKLDLGNSPNAHQVQRLQILAGPRHVLHRVVCLNPRDD